MTNRGTKLFFRRIKYCRQKRDERVAIHCSLFVVNFSAADDFFFDKKVLRVCRRDHYLNANSAYGIRRKTCLQNMANAFYRLFAVCRFFAVKTCLRNMANAFYRLFAVCRFFAILPLFRCCLRIVYSGLKSAGEKFLVSSVYPDNFIFHCKPSSCTPPLTTLK